MKGRHPAIAICILLSGLTALACGAVGSLLATPTPTPTRTPRPTATLAPTSTPTAPQIGREKKAQSDGTTLFTDSEGGYEVTFPAGWTVVITDIDDMEALLADLPEQEEAVEELLAMVRQADAAVFRAFAFNFGAQFGLFTPNINIVRSEDPLISSMSMAELVTANVQVLPNIIPGAIIGENGVAQTTGGLEIGHVAITWEMQDATGKAMPLTQRMIMFKPGDDAVTITLTVPSEAGVDLNPGFEQLINSIGLLD